MAFETYPLPDMQSKVGQLNDRINAQTEALTPVLAKMYDALGGAVTGQATALGKVGNKLTRAINGRIKSQGTALQPVVNNAISALNGAVSAQGSSLALQSALLPRLSQPGAAPASASLPSTPGAVPPSTLGSVGGGTPISQPVASLPAGVSSPPFTLSPQEILPSSTGPDNTVAIFNPPGQWMWVANCDTMGAEILERNSQYTIDRVQHGRYIPFRYNVNADPTSMQQWISAYAPNVISHACRAFLNTGDGWPANGDFVENAGDGAVVGQPVGPWPFDQFGNYTGN